MGRRVDIRPPRSARIWAIGFSVFWCGLLITFTIPLRGGVVEVILPIAMLVFGVSLAYRLVTLSAVTAGGAFVLRNNFRTRRLRRDEIEAFRVGQRPWGRTIFVLLRNQSLVQVDAAVRLLPSGRRRLDAWLAELREWLGETNQ